MKDLCEKRVIISLFLQS